MHQSNFTYDKNKDLEPNHVPLKDVPFEMSDRVEQKVSMQVSQKDSHLSWYICGNLIYLLIFVPITLLCLLIPSHETHSEFYLNFYERKNLYTTHFSFGKMIFWTLCCIIGFTFITLVNLRGIRGRNPFLGEKMDYRDIIMTLILAPIVYYLAPIIFLRDTYDMERGCLMAQGVREASKIDSLLAFSWGEIFNSLPNSYYSCHHYSIWEAFWYNYTFAIAFVFGLNYTHLNDIPIKHLTLSADAIKQWGITQYLFMGFVFIGILTIMISVFIMYYYAGILWTYLTALFIIILFFLVTNLIKMGRYQFHFHHYVWSFCLMTLCGYQHIYITILGGITSAIMMEGISHWGFDAWWEKKN